jgi:hypothetical protein
MAVPGGSRNQYSINSALKGLEDEQRLILRNEDTDHPDVGRILILDVPSLLQPKNTSYRNADLDCQVSCHPFLCMAIR